VADLECVLCQAKVDASFVFTAENGSHFCFTCWLDRTPHRVPRQRLTLVEL
jgi:hypothetical protein